jgi:hypothetical protein
MTRNLNNNATVCATPRKTEKGTAVLTAIPGTAPLTERVDFVVRGLLTSWYLEDQGERREAFEDLFDF